MKRQTLISALRALLATVSTFSIASGAHAQNATAPLSPPIASDTGTQDIIVTARKRQESILNVPVIETAIPQVQIERLGASSLKDIARLAPGLALGDSVLAVGTQVSLRGIGTSALDPGVEASVSLNLDGLQLSQGLAYTLGMFDVGQIEVLKGPQALFYGKSSPGGVISIRSADPTNEFELIARGSYEFEARERRGELIVSGPLSSTLKARFAGAYGAQDGFFFNVASALPGLGGLTPATNRFSPSEAYMMRGTLLWNPSERFDARLKFSYARDTVQYAATAMLAYCPEGTAPPAGFPRFLNANDDCKLNRTGANGAIDPAFFPGIPNNGVPFLDSKQTLGSVELNYHPTSELTISSTTGYYLSLAQTTFNTLGSAAGPFLVPENAFRRQETTEELRLNSEFAGRLNFTLGGFIQRASFSDHVQFRVNTLYGLPPIIADGTHDVRITTNSLFGQLRYRVVPELEIAGGVRWADEKRTNTAFDLITGSPVAVALDNPEIRSRNWSPELTVTYKPSADVTVFGALKQGYKSGSFSVATPPYPGMHNGFGDEKVRGGEIGLKARLADRRLLFNIAGYYYNYSGLQVGANVATVGGFTETRTVNAGSARVYGVEADFSYRAPIEGLSLRASVAWNNARATSLQNVPCYGGQTISAGCNEVYSAAANGGAGGFTAQDRSGTPLIRAPDWQMSFGFDYELPLNDAMKVVISSNTQFSSRYLTNLGYLFYQDAFAKTDLSLTLQGPRDRWELALIGKNLSNQITTGNCANGNNQVGLLGGQITGSTGVGPAGIDEISCYPDRGREVMLRVTLRPFK